jgi:hypothetical protein
VQSLFIYLQNGRLQITFLVEYVIYDQFRIVSDPSSNIRDVTIARSNEILGWEGVGNRYLSFDFLKRKLIGVCWQLT